MKKTPKRWGLRGFRRFGTKLVAFLLIAGFLFPSGAVLAGQQSGGHENNSEDSKESSHQQRDTLGSGPVLPDDSMGGHEKESPSTGSKPTGSRDRGDSNANDSRGNDLNNILFQTNVKPKNADELLKQNIPGIDNVTGALNYSFSIVTPPGRNGVEPHLVVSYNNQEKNYSSYVGLGWSLSIPYIQRVNKRGSENLYKSIDFSNFVSSMDGDLARITAVATTSITTYQAVNNQGNFLKYDFVNNSFWNVTDRAGNVYVFGNTSSSTQYDSNNSSHIFKWMLQEFRDTNGNFIRYEYTKDKNQVYPSKIVYTGNNYTDGIFEVDFVYQTRPDTAVSYAAGFTATTTKILSTIESKVNGNWVRKYEFAYATSSNTKALLLSSITESGFSEQSVITTLPAVEFSYESSLLNRWNTTASSTWVLPAPFMEKDNNTYIFPGTEIVDINGDSLPDIVGAYTWLNNGHGWSTTTDWSLPIPLIDGNDDSGARLVDVNGDVFPDLVRYKDFEEDNGVVYINNKVDGFEESRLYWQLPSDTAFVNVGGRDQGSRFADVNGDGLSDLMYSFDGAAYNGTYLNAGAEKSWISNGSFSLVPTFTTDENTDNGTRLADMNNDGLVDALVCNGNNPNDKYLHYNKGSGTGWTEKKLQLPYCFIDAANLDIGTRVVDINADQLPDIVSEGDYGYMLNTNDSFTPTQGIYGQYYFTLPANFIDRSNGDNGVRFEDVNGDGLVDFLRGVRYSNGNVQYGVYLMEGNRADGLQKIKNGRGGIVTIDYKTTSQYKDGGGNLLNPDLPIVLNTVNKISVNDGFATTSEITYTYQDGSYYSSEEFDRKPAGFGVVTETDTVGNITKSYFHQGNQSATSTGEYNDHISKLGKPYRIEQYDSDGNLFSKTINKWDRVDLGNNVSFVKLVETLDFLYDGDGDHKDKAESYVYNDSNGNLSQKVGWGVVSGNNDGTFTDTGTDKLTTEFTYATSSATSTITFVSREKILDQTSSTVRDTKIYYDGLSFGSVSKGNVTKQEMLKSGSTYIDVEKTYDGYGNVTQEKDPRDKTTTYAYDSYNLYRATTTNPVGHVTTALYDYSAGKPKQIKDPNGSVFQVVYDGLDRISEEKQPDSSSPSTLVTKAAYVYVDTVFPSIVAKEDYLNASTSIGSYTYLDGLGRPIQERRRAEDSNTYVVKDTAYDTRGMKEKESLPYFSTGSSRTTATTTGYLFNSFTYDALGRIKTIANSVGTTTNTYDDWKLTVTDAQGKTKDLIKDAQGNLVEVDEHNGTSTYTTLYEWNHIGNLTKITDALGNVRNFTYNNLGQRLTAQDLHAPSDTYFSTWAYSYDDAGNMASTTDGKGQTIQYTFDDINRPLTEDYTGQAGTEVTYVYDDCSNGKGRMCIATNASSMTQYAYDTLGRVATNTRTLLGSVYPTVYRYDYVGNPLSIVDPNGGETSYTYNAGGLVETVSYKPAGGSLASIVDDIDYSPEGKNTYQLNGNDTFIQKTYDPTHVYRLTHLYSESPLGGISPVLQDIAYTYDVVGNITQIDDQSPIDNGKTVVYGYDDLYRITSASTTAVSSGNGYKEQYTYDAIGNILTKGNSITTYSYQGTTTGSYANPHAVTKIRTTAYTYDNNGNTLSVGGKATSTWDYNNRLNALSSGATTTTYAYDPSGDRVVYSNGVALTRYPNKYVNIETVSGVTSTTTHIFLGDTAIATIERVGTTTNTYFTHTDHLSGATISTDDNAEVSEITDYYPYGSLRISDNGSSGFTEQRKFAGKEYDQDTSLLYMGSRYQNPAIGKFLSQDPASRDMDISSTYGKAMLADPQLQNMYSYAANNPLKNIDPDGESVQTFIQGAATGVAVGAAIAFVIAAAPVTIPAAVITTAAIAGTAAIGYGTYANYQAYQSGEISKDQFDYNAGNLLGGLVAPSKMGKMSGEVSSAAKSSETLALPAPSAKSTGVFPANPSELMPDAARDARGFIYPNSYTRIRPEMHGAEPGAINSPRHTDQHYHVDVRVDPNVSFNNNNNTTTIRPPGYTPGYGTGFLPGERFPGRTIRGRSH